MPLNPNQAKDYVNSYVDKADADKVSCYPSFFNKLSLDNFRHIQNLVLTFKSPISVVSGSNRCGKTSVLMAIACSHYNFERQDVTKGIWNRATWGHLMRFTSYDVQTQDWVYNIECREGTKPIIKKATRKLVSKKWSGVAKKEGQIGSPTKHNKNGGRHVILIDLNRINPGRHLSSSCFKRTKKIGHIQQINPDIEEYLSYILEIQYNVGQLGDYADNVIYGFNGNGADYTSFNTASGEDVLINILTQISHVPEKSLILIDEIEIGLHPKIQRRLMDVLFILSMKRHLQFIITTHSYAVIDSVNSTSRIFIESMNGNCRAIHGLTTYEALTRMDSESFPVLTVYVEDDVSKMIVLKAIEEINDENHNFSRLINTIIVGSAQKTYDYFKNRQSLRVQEHNVSKVACILDGDMEGDTRFPQEESLFFHYSDVAPEKMLLQFYLQSSPNQALQYHLEKSNPHCLLSKMVEQGISANENVAFQTCFQKYRNSQDGSAHFKNLKEFLSRQTTI